MKWIEGVQLRVKEITKESDPEAYEVYYQKALSEMQDKYDENTTLSFAKFYDIAFVYEDVEIEPSGNVNVRIEYKQAVETDNTASVDTIHFDKKFPQTKLVRVIRGIVYDVAVDLRKDSRTYGRYHGGILSEENKRQFLIPRGFAHGFLVLSDVAEFCYKCDDFYHPNDEGGLAWNDPEIGIK